ncbi:MAG: hypothetical protein AAB540_00305, partial [Patescibacteria group bacterium]
NMPGGMNGIQLALHVRTVLGETKIPFLLMSAGWRPEFLDTVKRAVRAGYVDAFLEKPFEPEALLAAVEKAIERRIMLLGEDDAE